MEKEELEDIRINIKGTRDIDRMVHYMKIYILEKIEEDINMAEIMEEETGE